MIPISLDHYQFLSPMWALILHEGVRGHHLLFSAEDVAVFENCDSFNSSEVAQNSCLLEEMIIQAASLSSIGELTEYVSSLGRIERLWAYRAYLYMIRHWSSVACARAH